MVGIFRIVWVALRAMCFLCVGIVSSSLLTHIPHIITLGARKEMVGVHAARVVAVVCNYIPWRDGGHK